MLVGSENVYEKNGLNAFLYVFGLSIFYSDEKISAVCNKHTIPNLILLVSRFMRPIRVGYVYGYPNVSVVTFTHTLVTVGPDKI